MLVGAAAGTVIALRNPVQYTARAEMVTGNYSLPPEVASQPGMAKAGALGLELPAETQARIIASPTIVDVAAKALRLNDGDSQALRSGVKASATTDNSYSISATAATPEAAAAGANAVAAAYLQYRADIGRQDMNILAQRAHTAAKDSQAAAAALDEPLARAQATNASFATSILAKREELEHAASNSASIAAALDDAVKNFNGGGAVVRPATSADVDASLSMLMMILLGSAVGLLAGLAFAVVRRQFSDRITDRRDIMRTTGLTEVFELRGHSEGSGTGQLLLRSVEQSSGKLGISAEQIAVRPLTPSGRGAAGLLGLANAAHMSLRSVAVVALHADAGEDLAAELSRSDASTDVKALSGKELAGVNGEIGSEASAVFGTTPTPTGTYDVLLLATGPHFSANRDRNSLPAGFSGPTILIVNRRKDRVQDLGQAVDELSAAGLPVVAFLLVDQPKTRKGGFGWEGLKDRKARPEAIETSLAPGSEVPSGEGRKSPTTAGSNP
jgi:capsular polysaccharide biosynthesis protein